MIISCPYSECGQQILLDISMAGTQAACPSCSRPFACPGESAFPPEERQPTASTQNHPNKSTKRVAPQQVSSRARTQRIPPKSKRPENSGLQTHLGARCPCCLSPATPKTPGFWMSGLFGIFGMLFRGYECKSCGPIPFGSFPGATKAGIILWRFVLLFILIGVAGIVLSLVNSN